MDIVAEEAEGATVELLSQALAAVAGGHLAALVAGGPDPLAMAAGSAAAQVSVARAARAVLARRAAKVEEMCAHAAATAGTLPQRFVEDCLADPVALELLGFAMDAAVQAIAEAKLRVIGTLLAEGVLARDRARLDMTYQLLRIWRDLEAPHVAVLEHMARVLYPQIPETAGLEHRLGTYSIETLSRPMSDYYESGLPHLADGMHALVAVLQSHGLVEPGASEERWRRWVGDAVMDNFRRHPPTDELRVTHLGLAVLDRYRSAGSRA